MDFQTIECSGSLAQDTRPSAQFSPLEVIINRLNAYCMTAEMLNTHITSVCDRLGLHHIPNATNPSGAVKEVEDSVLGRLNDCVDRLHYWMALLGNTTERIDQIAPNQK